MEIDTSCGGVILSPLLVAMVILATTAMVVTLRAAGHRPLKSAVDLAVYDGLRAVGTYSAWMAAWALAAWWYPCWFTNGHSGVEHGDSDPYLIGLWLWLGIPITAVCAGLWFSAHAARRAELVEQAVAKHVAQALIDAVAER